MALASSLLMIHPAAFWANEESAANNSFQQPVQQDRIMDGKAKTLIHR
jgi:hypothetical protein